VIACDYVREMYNHVYIASVNDLSYCVEYKFYGHYELACIN